MNTVTLWVIYVAIFIIVFAAIALSCRNRLGIAIAFLVAAIVALIIVAAIAMWCTPYEFWFNSGCGCLWFIAVLLIIIGIIFVIIAAVMNVRDKKKIEEHHEPNAIHKQLSNHPDAVVSKQQAQGAGAGAVLIEEEDIIERDCDPEGRCDTRTMSRRGGIAARKAEYKHRSRVLS